MRKDFHRISQYVGHPVLVDLAAFVAQLLHQAPREHLLVCKEGFKAKITTGRKLTVCTERVALDVTWIYHAVTVRVVQTRARRVKLTGGRVLPSWEKKRWYSSIIVYCIILYNFI